MTRKSLSFLNGTVLTEWRHPERGHLGFMLEYHNGAAAYRGPGCLQCGLAFDVWGR